MQARELMESDVKTVAPDDDVADAFKKFARYPFSGFPVVDEEDRVVGVVTESDLVDLFEPDDETLWIPIGLPAVRRHAHLSGEGPPGRPRSGRRHGPERRPLDLDVMSTDVATVTPDTDVDEVLSIYSPATIRTSTVCRSSTTMDGSSASSPVRTLFGRSETSGWREYRWCSRTAVESKRSFISDRLLRGEHLQSPSRRRRSRRRRRPVHL